MYWYIYIYIYCRSDEIPEFDIRAKKKCQNGKADYSTNTAAIYMKYSS